MRTLTVRKVGETEKAVQYCVTFWIAVFVFLILWGLKLFFEWWDGVVRFLNYVIWG